MQGERRDQIISLIGVLAMAALLPGILRLTNRAIRFIVGAEGRLAAVTVETDRILGPLPAPWRAMAQGGEEVKTFLDGTAGEVKMARPAYIRIDHIYDQFKVVSRGNSGLEFNWTELDGVVAKIQEVGARPFLSLSYMPQAISSGDILAKPRDWNEWSLVVQKTVEHFSGDLGIENVYYEVWNEPDLFGEWKINGNKDYKTLYLYASRGAQKASGVRPFKLGGPGTTGLYKNWLEVFFPYILENRLRLDFFSWHRYDGDVLKYLEDAQNVEAWLDRHPYFVKVEKIVTEMGPQAEIGGANETKTGAAHLVAAMREMMFKVNLAFNFAVKGQWGMVGKPRMEALKLLSDLGEQRLSLTGEGTWIRAIGAKKGDTYQVILSNYDQKESHSEVVPVTFINLNGREFVVRRKPLGGKMIETYVATTEAMLQQEVAMTPNSVVLLELVPKVVN
jgi:hypothetical protein